LVVERGAGHHPAPFRCRQPDIETLKRYFFHIRNVTYEIMERRKGQKHGDERTII
jgi:hypothetical protein